MGLISLIVAIALVGVALYLIGLLPMDPIVRKVLNILVVVFVVLWALQQLGLIGGVLDLRLR